VNRPLNRTDVIVDLDKKIIAWRRGELNSDILYNALVTAAIQFSKLEDDIQFSKLEDEE
jgi:hypothetical protein